MENQIIPFKYGTNEVRSLLINNEPWFVAKDVCEILDIGDTSKAIGRLDDDEKGTNLIPTLGGVQEMSVISESGLYSLTLSSKKPEAKPFKRWITHEVIPTIRKTGTYSHPMSQAELIAAQANLLVEIERKTNTALQAAETTQKRLTGALDALAAAPEADWQTATKDKIVGVCKVNGLSYLKEYDRLYKELEDSAHVNLKARVSRLRERMEKGGYKYKERRDISKLHVISLDPALKLAFDGIVRRFAAKYAGGTSCE